MFKIQNMKYNNDSYVEVCFCIEYLNYLKDWSLNS